MTIFRDAALTEQAHSGNARKLLEEAQVSKDLLKLLVGQKMDREDQAAGRDGIMQQQIPEPSLAQRTARAVAPRVGGVARTQDNKRQNNMRRMAERGIAGAPGMRTAPGGIANGPMVKAAKRGGMVRRYQEGGPVRGQVQRTARQPGPIDIERVLDALQFVESSGNPNAVSPRGARGLYQIMPKTAKGPGYGVAPIDLNTASSEEQRNFARQYLTAMLNKYNGDLGMALAAYNAGPRRVDEAVAKQGALPAETVNYVPKVLAAMDEQAPAQPPARQGREMPRVPEFIDEQQYPTTAGMKPVGPSRGAERAAGVAGAGLDALIPSASATDMADASRLQGQTTRQGPGVNLGEPAVRPGDEDFKPITGTPGTIPAPRTNITVPGTDTETPEERGIMQRAWDGLQYYFPTWTGYEDRELPTSQRIGRRINEVITAPGKFAKEVWEDAGETSPFTVGDVGNVASSALGLPPIWDPNKEVEVDGIGAAPPTVAPQRNNMPPTRADALKGMMLDAQNTADLRRAATPEPSKARGYRNERMDEQMDPRRRKMSGIAALLSARGGKRGLGEGAKAGVAAGQAWDLADNQAIDQNLNADLDRETQLGMWGMREAGYVQRAQIAAQQAMTELSAEYSQDMLEKAYEHFTEGPGLEMFMNAKEAVLKDQKNADPRQMAMLENSILKSMMANWMNQMSSSSGSFGNVAELETVEP